MRTLHDILNSLRMAKSTAEGTLSHADIGTPVWEGLNDLQAHLNQDIADLTSLIGEDG
jgi:hypothetical protein